MTTNRIPVTNGTPDRFAHEHNDCTVRALANCLGLPYKTAHGLMAKHTGRVDGKGANTIKLARAMQGLGFTVIPTGKTRTAKHLEFNLKIKAAKGVTVAKLLPTLPSRAIVGVRGHVFAVVDGKVMDTGSTCNGNMFVDVVFK